MPIDIEHFKAEFRNCMYQLSDDDLLDVLKHHTLDFNRLEFAIQQARAWYEIEPPEDEEQT